MNFKNEMQVIKTDFNEFSLATFLSNVGGSLGLWLGLGMPQLGEVIINSLKTVVKKTME